eukprot:INCI17610.3.p1 GENE.INCI17610.3~~INCI17610.3.p1  ORF type:complete len:366 (+),score=50.45 INCI17610.3:449-1546(+)
MEEYLLQLPMSQLVRNAALSVGSFLRLPSSTLAGLRTVSCRPDIQDVLDLARSTEDDWVSFSCQVPTSAFCVPDAAVLGLADRRFEIVAVQQNESHTSLWAAVSLIVGFALLFLRPIYVEDRVLSHVSFTVFMCMWTVAAPSLLYAAAALGVSIVSHVVLPRLHRAQLQTFFQAASIILVSEASSFAYGSIFLLALYLFTWVVHTAINVGIADEREEAEALQEYMDQRSDHVKQEGLHDIVDAVLEDDSILKRLSDKALQQIARMAQARTESGPTARLDDLPEDERLLYGIYQEGRAAAERLRRARWLPLAVVRGFDLLLWRRSTRSNLCASVPLGITFERRVFCPRPSWPWVCYGLTLQLPCFK